MTNGSYTLNPNPVIFIAFANEGHRNPTFSTLIRQLSLVFPLFLMVSPAEMQL